MRMNIFSMQEMYLRCISCIVDILIFIHTFLHISYLYISYTIDNNDFNDIFIENNNARNNFFL